MHRDCKEYDVLLSVHYCLAAQSNCNGGGVLVFGQQHPRAAPHDFDLIQLIRLRDDAESLGMNLIFNANALRCLGLGSHIILVALLYPCHLHQGFWIHGISYSVKISCIGTRAFVLPASHRLLQCILLAHSCSDAQSEERISIPALRAPGHRSKYSGNDWNGLLFYAFPVRKISRKLHLQLEFPLL